jgi:hypothetical protein
MAMKLLHKNYWRTGSLAAPSSQHPQFPNTDTQIDTRMQGWRTRYGSGTGNGKFVVNALNAIVDFDEGGAEIAAVLTYGAYNGQTLAAEIKARLDDGGALTYTVTYDEATAKFTIAATGNFTLRWQSGTHIATDASDLLGFSSAADDTGAATYTGDYRRIHYSEEYTGQLDAGSMVEVNYIALLGHNLSSAAVITLHGGDDASWTNETVDVITWTTGDIWFTLPASRTKRFYQINISDPENAAGYLEIKTIVLGKYWVPNRTYGTGYADGYEDVSTSELSDSLVSFGQEKPRVRVWQLPFAGLDATAIAEARGLMDECGIVHAFIICLDSAVPATNTFFVRNTGLAQPSCSHVGYWNWGLTIREVV